jgi:hypothetical protein
MLRSIPKNANKNKAEKPKAKIELPLSIRWFDLICLKRCIKDKEGKEYLDKCKEIIKSKLSIEHIIEKFCELDKLKRTILSEEQFEAFKRMPKLTLEEHIESIQQANIWKIQSILSPVKSFSRKIHKDKPKESENVQDKSVNINLYRVSK